MRTALHQDPDLSRFCVNVSAEQEALAQVNGLCSQVAEMQKQIETLQLTNVVHQLGFREDIPAVFQTMDLMLLPSQQPDPFPTVILEAMASAKPVIATQFGGAVEMIEAGRTGDLMPPDQVDTAVAIIETWLDKNRLKIAGEAARKRVLEKFSLDAWEHKMINYLE